MPWQEKCSMTERTRFVAALLEGTESMSALCRRFGVSRQCAYKWKLRYDEGGFEAMEDASRAPRRHPNETPEDVVETILEARRAHPTWGPKKIGPWLQRTSPTVDVPCTSTVGAILKRGGVVASRVRRPRPPRSVEGLTPGEAPNLVWCTDFKGQFDVGNGRTCWPLTLTDLYSRYLLTCQALTTSRTRQAMPVFLAAFQWYGLPQIIRSDNGSPFASRAPGRARWRRAAGPAARRRAPPAPRPASAVGANPWRGGAVSPTGPGPAASAGSRRRAPSRSGGRS